MMSATSSSSTFAFSTTTSSTPHHHRQQISRLNNYKHTTTKQLASSSIRCSHRNNDNNHFKSSPHHHPSLLIEPPAKPEEYGSTTTSVVTKKSLINIRTTRREAVRGLGLTYVFGGLIFQNAVSFLLEQPQAAEASETGAQICQEFTVTPSGLQFCDQVIGTGPIPTKGQLIKAHYVGKLENGKVFDSSYNRGKPLTFRIGVGEVIRGWDQGILGGDGIPPMLTGGKRRLKLPSELGYGMRGAGCKGGSCIIPPNSTLLFDVEFVGKA